MSNLQYMLIDIRWVTGTHSHVEVCMIRLIFSNVYLRLPTDILAHDKTYKLVKILQTKRDTKEWKIIFSLWFDFVKQLRVRCVKADLSRYTKFADFPRRFFVLAAQDIRDANCRVRTMHNPWYNQQANFKTVKVHNAEKIKFYKASSHILLTSIRWRPCQRWRHNSPEC